MKCDSKSAWGDATCSLDAGHAGNHRGTLKMNCPPHPPRYMPVEWFDAPPLPPPTEPLILVVRS